MICFVVCIYTGGFVDNLRGIFADHRFDDTTKLNGVLTHVRDNLRNCDAAVKEEQLQWLCQSYMGLFGFYHSAEGISDEYASKLISFIQSSRHEQFVIQPNAFTQAEIASQLLRFTKLQV